MEWLVGLSKEISQAVDAYTNSKAVVVGVVVVASAGL